MYAMEIETRQSGQSLDLKTLIDQAARALQRAVDEKGGSFAPSQRRVLCMLAMRGEMTQQRLLDELELAPASLSEVIGKLAEKGLVTREKLESDRRIMVIALTPDGRMAAEKMLAADADAVNSAFVRLTPEEKQQLATLLKRITPLG